MTVYPADANVPAIPGLDPTTPLIDTGSIQREAQSRDTAEYPDGTVYLLHLDPPYKHARHYTGHAEPGRLHARLAAHAAGTGARLMQVVKAAGGSFRLARTWPGSRTRERELKDRHEAPRLCPICTPHPLPAQASHTTGLQPPRKPQPVAPQLPTARAPAYERGAARARRDIQRQIDAGFSADRIAEVQRRIFSAFVPERARAETREEARGYRDTAEAMIVAHRQATTPQPAIAPGDTAAHLQEGNTMTADTAPGTLPVKPATEWMKGAKTAHDLIIRQVEAGHSADHIAARWDQALATYDDTTATPAERDWHAGAEETARDMIQTWRDIQRAEAEQALVAETPGEASHQADAPAGREAEAG